jgi:hypothetical protein
MKYCRAVPEVVKSKENLAYLKDFISKVGYENSSEVCFRSNSCTLIRTFQLLLLFVLNMIGLKGQNGIMVLLGNPKAIHILHSVIFLQ